MSDNSIALQKKQALRDLLDGKATAGSSSFLGTIASVNQKEPAKVTKGQSKQDGVAVSANRPQRLNEEHEEYAEREPDYDMASRIAKSVSAGLPTSANAIGAVRAANPDEIAALLSGKKSTEIIAERALKENMLYEASLAKQQMSQPLKEIVEVNNKPKHNMEKMNKAEMLELLEEALSSKLGKLLMKDLLTEMVKPIILDYLKNLQAKK